MPPLTLQTPLTYIWIQIYLFISYLFIFVIFQFLIFLNADFVNDTMSMCTVLNGRERERREHVELEHKFMSVQVQATSNWYNLFGRLSFVYRSLFYARALTIFSLSGMEQRTKTRLTPAASNEKQSRTNNKNITKNCRTIQIIK